MTNYSIDDVVLPPGWAWGHQPRRHGDLEGGINLGVYPGRAVLLIPNRSWRHEPEFCPSVHEQPWAFTEWVLDGQILICTYCGLDCT